MREERLKKQGFKYESRLNNHNNEVRLTDESFGTSFVNSSGNGPHNLAQQVITLCSKNDLKSSNLYPS